MNSLLHTLSLITYITQKLTSSDIYNDLSQPETGQRVKPQLILINRKRGSKKRFSMI